MALTLTAVYEPVENGWVQARLRELPAVITAAPNRREAEQMLEDALAQYLASLDRPPKVGRDLVQGKVRIVAESGGRRSKRPASAR
jgi:predicted RNase H-like HicB family nuclease